MESNVKERRTSSLRNTGKEERIIALLEEINSKLPEREEKSEREVEVKEKDEKKGNGVFWAVLCPSLFLLIILVRMVFLLLS